MFPASARSAARCAVHVRVVSVREGTRGGRDKAAGRHTEVPQLYTGPFT